MFAERVLCVVASAGGRRQTAAGKQHQPGLSTVGSSTVETDRRLSVNQLARLEQIIRLHVQRVPCRDCRRHPHV